MASEPKVFISYNRADRDWAEWIDRSGYQDFRPGGNLVLRVQQATTEPELPLRCCRRLILKLNSRNQK
jgi:hypothetical protein